MTNLQDRCIGAFVGLAVGDALGTTNEFLHPDNVEPIQTIVGGGPFKLQAGEWTDDTAMALCLSDSLIKKGFNLHDQLDHYIKWYHDGENSCTGDCFDIGYTTADALDEYIHTGVALSKNTNARTSGNGGIMRLAPVVIYHHTSIDAVIQASVLQSVTTHGSSLCTESAALMAEIMHKLLYSENLRETITSSSKLKFANHEIEKIAAHHYIDKELYDVFDTSGYVVSSLEFALWCLWNTSSFDECVLLAANAGGDSDTNAAIAGQLAGAFYGYKAIPKEWREMIAMKDKIVDNATTLYNRAKAKPWQSPSANVH
jgi:ADP-ribosyl-[dinitrogen reductase] hydrolase